MVFTAEQIASMLNGKIEGDKDAKVSSFGKIEEGKAGDISFLANMQYEKYLYETKASVVLVNHDFVPQAEVGATLIRVDNAYESIAKLLTIYQSMTERRTGVSSMAFVHPSAQIGKDCLIEPFAYIGEGVKIGDCCDIHSHCVVMTNATIGKNTILYPNVTIYKECKVGNNCILHSGVVIGADGFGFAPTPEGYEKIPQVGIAEIADNVEIGANTCVDRSTMGVTKVGKGVKLDNLVQIAHNVEIGENTVISSQAGVAGSAKVGQWCMFGGQVGIAGHIQVGDKTLVGAQSGIPGGALARNGNIQLMGYPAVEHKAFARQAAALKALPELIREFTSLKKEIEKLKNNINH